MIRSLDDIIKEHNHICWYPSADADFRGLLYLSDRYFEWKKIQREEGQQLPDLFIMTDIDPKGTLNYPSDNLGFGEKGNSKIQLLKEGKWREIRELYMGFRPRPLRRGNENVTQITVSSIEKLKDIELAFHPEFFTDIYGKPAYYGNAFYIRAHVVSRQREDSHEYKEYEYDCDVVYILADNTSFARDYLLKNKISTEYVIQIRYGDAGFGGSALSGSWLGLILDSLNCKYFMSNPRYARNADMSALLTEVKEFFAGYQMKTVSYNMIASLRNHNSCINTNTDDFDDINLYRVMS